MLTKDQALAVMDAKIIAAEAERLRRLERRIGRMRIIYPELRRVPLDAIPELLHQARRNMRRQWTFYLPFALLVASMLWFLLLRPLLDLGEPESAAYFFWYALALGSTLLSVYVHIRAFLSRNAPLLYPKSQD